MGNVRFQMGDILEGGMDLTVFPCSAKGTVSTATRNMLVWNGLPTPLDLQLQLEHGEVSELIPVPGSKRPRFIVFAASVLNRTSSAEIIEKIGVQLGAITVANPGIRLVEAPLLGTGAGGLKTIVAGKALSKGFKSSSVSEATLFIFVFDHERFTILSSLLETERESEQEQASISSLTSNDSTPTAESASIATKHEDKAMYDIALSFAGEDRQYAQGLAQRLQKRGVNVFYDEFEQAKLWGKNLYDYLADLYSNQAAYCAIFISEHYERKAWTNHERQNAQARAFRENREYILPLKLDDTSIPGLPETVGYVDLRHTTLDRVAELVVEKLQVLRGVSLTPILGNNDGLPTMNVAIPLPKVKKNPTQHDKDRFLHEAFAFIRQYFQEGLTRLEEHDPQINTSFLEIHKLKFVGKLYLNGNLESQCKLWIGRTSSTESINYSEAFTSFDNDDRVNDSMTVHADEGQLFLKFSNRLLGREQVAEYLWKKFTSSLE